MTNKERSVEGINFPFRVTLERDGSKEVYVSITEHRQTLQAERKRCEEQSKCYIILMSQALGETELPEEVWEKIAKVNQLILDK